MRMLILVLATTIATSAVVGHAGGPPEKRLRAFQSEAELRSFLKSFADEQKRVRSRRPARVGGVEMPDAAPSTTMTTAAPSPTMSMAGAAESITNVQHAGVDGAGASSRLLSAAMS
jgi:hypothetical protein